MEPVEITQAEYEKLKPMIHHLAPQALMDEMAALRVQYLHLALAVLRGQGTSHSQALALIHLEDSLLSAMQGLALQGVPQLPPEFVVPVTG